MSDTKIEWTDRTWNPVRGCSRVSSGCDNCYAMRVAHRFSGPAVQDPSGDRSLDKPAGPYHGLTVLRPKSASRPGVDWSGRARFVPEMLEEPLRWRRPQRVFVNSMSDLFHESLENEQIAAIFGIMAAAPQHTFQVLTKRPKRAAEWFAWIKSEAHPDGGPGEATACGIHAANFGADVDYMGLRDRWPLPNVWLGVSAENQATYNERVPVLVHQCPAALHWVSAEPLLGPLKLRGTGHIHLGWLVVGGESGNGARPFDVDWASSLIAECRESAVPIFVKQLGARPYTERIVYGDSPFGTVKEGVAEDQLVLANRKGGDVAEWPLELRVREFPEGATR